MGLCTPGERQKCEVENESHLEWACAHCQKKQYTELHDYTKKLLGIYELQRGGYPLQANDLTLDEWRDLGRLAKILNPMPKGMGAAMMMATMFG